MVCVIFEAFHRVLKHVIVAMKDLHIDVEDGERLSPLLFLTLIASLDPGWIPQFVTVRGAMSLIMSFGKQVILLRSFAQGPRQKREKLEGITNDLHSGGELVYQDSTTFSRSYVTSLAFS